MGRSKPTRRDGWALVDSHDYRYGGAPRSGGDRGAATWQDVGWTLVRKLSWPSREVDSTISKRRYWPPFAELHSLSSQGVYRHPGNTLPPRYHLSRQMATRSEPSRCRAPGRK